MFVVRFCCKFIIYLLCATLLLTGCKTTLWRPESGVWYCDELQLQLSFDSESPCFVMQDGVRVDCTWFNNRGSKYITVCYLTKDYDYITILDGKYVDLTDDRYIVENMDTGIQYIFCKIGDSSVVPSDEPPIRP